MGLKEAFGAAVRQHRKAAQLSQDDLAYEAGLDRTYISGIETGRRNPSLLTIELLADAMDVSLVTLFETVSEIVGSTKRRRKPTGARPVRRRGRVTR